MHRSLESLLLTLLGTVPALVMLIVFFHNNSHVSHGFSFLVVFAVLCACMSILVARLRLLGSQASEAQTQTDDAEDCQGDGECPEDAPPIYEVVVAKPPPYEYIYDGSHTPSCGEKDSEAGIRMSDGCTDSDLPTYSQVAQAPSPV